jgi:hypothetical protein
MVGWAKQVTNSFAGGLYALATMTLLGAILTVVSIKVRKGGTPDAAEKVSAETTTVA